jgi:hypothetical protein
MSCCESYAMLPAGCCPARKVLSCPRLNPECCPVKRQKCEEVVEEEEEEEEGAGEEEEEEGGGESENPPRGSRRPARQRKPRPRPPRQRKPRPRRSRNSAGGENSTEPPCINFKWSGPPVVTGKKATGSINGINYTFVSDNLLSTGNNPWGLQTFYTFPREYNVPILQPAIGNEYASKCTLTFDSPIENPSLLFASIGQPGTPVSVTFSVPVTVVFSTGTAFTQDSPTKITAQEGYVILQCTGTYSSLSFEYLMAEYWVDFMFGANFPCEESQTTS